MMMRAAFEQTASAMQRGSFSCACSRVSAQHAISVACFLIIMLALALLVASLRVCLLLN